MNLQNTLIKIVRLALWDIPIEEEKVLPFLSEDDWRELYYVARCQGLSAIFSDGIGKLSEKSLACSKVLIEEGIPAILKSEISWQEHLRLATVLASVYEKNGIRMMLLKGIGLSLLYPEPKHRESGDIDVYLFGDYEKGNRLAETLLNARVEKFSRKEDHIVIGNNQFDNHICFVWASGRTKRELDSFLKGLLDNAELERIEETSILLPPANFNMLFLLSHSYSHFMREGMPLRQMTDLACFLKKYDTEINWKECLILLDRFHLKKYADAVVSFIVVYFGLSISYNPKVSNQILSSMKRDILGNSHPVEYHDSRLASKYYTVRTAWHNRWRYEAFYEGGFFRFLVDATFRIG